MKLKLRNTQGQVVRSVDVRDDVFGVPPNPALVHQVMVGQLSNARQGTARVKNRARVSGGGAKPRPQKHTGRARMGTIRAPQNRGGGVVFGPTIRNYQHRTPKRMKRQSLVVTLSEIARDDRLVVLENLVLDQPKTKEVVKILEALEIDSSVLLVADGADDTALRCTRNVPRLKRLPASLLNTVDLLNHKKIIMTLEAVRRAEELWGGAFVRRPSADAPVAAEGGLEEVPAAAEDGSDEGPERGEG